MSGEIAIALENVSASYKLRRGFLKYKKIWPVKDLSMEIYHGETLGIIGRNGVGKSTLLRTIAGIAEPDKGKLINYDVDVLLLSHQMRMIPHLTGRENAILTGMLMGYHRREIEERMDDIIAFAELGEFIDQPVSTYSSGMGARLAFSVGYQADPDVMLIDEILGVGDEAFRIKSTAAMREKINSNKTVLFVSHVMDSILELCDRVIWLHDGQIRMQGDTREVVEAYQDFFHK
jgi:lipopolysaccharide transport system ATP-binding protein